LAAWDVLVLSGMNPEQKKRFALDILAFLRALPRTVTTRSICEQLIRSATGTAANHRAACRSRSDIEFIARIGVALEEADESALWLEILIECGLTSSREAFRLFDEANQLSAIFAKSRITSIEGMKRRKASAGGRDPYVFLQARLKPRAVC
jgi:four helix bundle protein